MTVPPYVNPLGFNEVRLFVPQNNDALLTFTIVDPNNSYQPVNITGAGVTFYRKQTRFVSDTDPTTITYAGLVTNGPAGICTVTIPHTDNTTSGVIWYRLDVTLSTIRTAQYGPLEVIPV